MNPEKVMSLFNIKYPIIQGGMVWCSGWKLASAVSNAGGLGLIGSGSMYPDVLDEHIKKCKQATNEPFGVNLPLLYPQIQDHIEVILKNKVPIVFTSAGNPKTYTKVLQEAGIIVVHVVSSVKFALKSQEAGVDAVVAEGFEAGGHNGREETTTMCLIPDVADAIDIPLIAAGGIGSGRAMMAALALGANGVQIGSQFAITKESSASNEFKEYVVAVKEGGTKLSLKSLTPVRLLKNNFFKQVFEAEQNGASPEVLKELLGKGRAKKGIFEGNLEEGELEIGQVSAMIHEIKSAKEVLHDIWEEFCDVKKGFRI
jgi:enoyl-[acyl-carrier protein] reductase II